ncbi:N,N'-diacetyllegionaminate synthase [Oxalobacteraceae bacterium GrIS 1.18]
MSHVFIIAEAGVNHNGDIQTAFDLIDAAHLAGVDAIKFQTFKTEKIVTRSAQKADYQKNALAESQFDMIKKLELSYAEFEKLQQYCHAIGLCFLSTPDESDSLDFLADVLHVPMLKIGSGEVNNLPFLKQIAAKNLPMILSTGMSTLGEVETAVGTIQAVSNAPLTLLHCTTNYPCPMDQVNLSAMLTLRDAFRLPVGYSDHTLGIEVPVAAAALGATVIEKHFTLDTDMAGPDHKASLDPQQLAAMVRSIRHIEAALGDGIKRPNADEEKTRQVVRKRLVATRDLAVGQVLTDQEIDFKRADSGIFVEHLDLVVGKKLIAAVSADSALQWQHLMK